MKYSGPIALVLFVIEIAAVPILNGRSATSRTAVPAPGVAEAGDASRYGTQLEEVSKSAGVDFTHHAPKLDPKLDHIMPQVASMGASVAVADFDRDGWADFYVTDSGEGTPNRLYHNLKDGTFRDVAAEMGVADLNRPGTGASMGAVWGDYDNSEQGSRLYSSPQVGPARALPQRRRQGFHAGHGEGRVPRLGQRRLRDVARLRPRQLPGPLPRRLLGRRARPLASGRIRR